MHRLEYFWNVFGARPLIREVSDRSHSKAWCAMTPKRVNPASRVVYIRDAKSFTNLLVTEKMDFSDAVEMALAEHCPGESPVIIGTGLQLIGIDAIRAARESRLKSI